MREGGELTICYMRYIREWGLSLLMLYNAICLRRTECCFYITFISWLSLKGRDLATVIV